MGLLFLLERSICLKASKVKKAPLSFTTGWGRRQLCLALPPHTNLASPGGRFFPGAATPHSCSPWLCVLAVGVQEGWGWSLRHLCHFRSQP